ncbi:MAG TPA: SPW repeat protein [Streptosporangiaceae bacterium]|nr:SPW repeat protein [Streptosporangiaceae bacterium]
MTGLWVAVSPWFLTLQAPRGGNATANNLTVGLVVVALGILAAERLPGRPGLPVASLLAGIWVLISPFILDARVSITASMYWSNIWAGAVVIVAGLGLLAVCSGLPGTGRAMP